VESTLALKLVDLSAEVGLFLGWGRGNIPPYTDPPWSSQQQAAITSAVASGLRQFYFPPPMEGMTVSYNWSFLTPTAQLDLPANAMTVQLPDDFGGFEGQITITSQPTLVWYPIKLTNEGMIREQYAQTPLMSGRPLMAAVRPKKGTGATQGQRFELFVFPNPDIDYTLTFIYYILPDYLTGATPYAYGGATHIETILESCLAIAEQRLDDSSTVHSAKFQERLMASITMDRRNKPQQLGVNWDRSDQTQGWRPYPFNHFSDVILIQGQVY
jgi:hypothetical protein